tara:strand:- start:529 stop:846 length:318 start_codon:yes stop_codon:yes gene_type:complete
MKNLYFNRVILFLLSFFLLSCGARLTSTPEDYMHKSEYDLCVDYLSMAGNVHQSNRLEAIKRLNYNCEPYVEQAKAKKKADDEFYESLKELLDATIDCTVTECYD